MGGLYDDLEEFVRDHRSHASTVNATEPAWNVFERWVTPGDAVDDLALSRLGVFGS